ncbi:MAG TPA: hypothetical protein VF139_13925 [Candidatus Polarisedimenticolaceae bacterium]
MKLAIAFASLLLGAPAPAGEHEHPAPSATNPAFEQLKSLAGTWTGKAISEDGPGSDASVVFKVVAAGSAVHETMFPGTPHEMVNLYHLDGSDVVVTHYCAGGNQPRMKLASADGNVLAFRFAGGTNIPKKGSYMHAVTLTLDGGKLVESWESVDGGTPVGTARFELTRR